MGKPSDELDVFESRAMEVIRAFVREHEAWAVDYALSNGAGKLADAIAREALLDLALRPGPWSSSPVRVVLGLMIAEKVADAKVDGRIEVQRRRARWLRRESYIRKAIVWMLDQAMDATDPRVYGPPVRDADR